MPTCPSLPRALALGLLWLAATAQAHDTWFELQTAPGPGERQLALGTGNQFPLHETAVGSDYLRLHACRTGQAAAVPLLPAGYTGSALLLNAPPSAAGTASCWAELVPFDIELPAAKVALYLDEIRASSAQRAAWAALQARGQPWKERYTKHARIELAGGTGTSAPPPPAPASGMGMDVLLQAPTSPPRAGDELVFQVLRDGAPLPGFDVELRSERSRLGLWLRTDGNGRVRVRAPAAGAWVLRGTDLRRAAHAPDEWESRFVTLAFAVGP